MVCCVKGHDGTVYSIQRIILKPGYSGKADVADQKMSMGTLNGGAVRLGQPGEEFGMTEGVETGLADQQLYETAVWCALGGANMKNVVLPDGVTRVAIYGDNGDAGRRFARNAGKAFQQQGREVWLVFPPKGCDDFNTALLNKSQEVV